MADIVRPGSGELGELVPVGNNTGFLPAEKIKFRDGGGVLQDVSAANPLPVTGGGGGGGGAATIADGADVAQGAVADAAVTGDTAGTLSAKLRGLSKIWTDVWDSTTHRLNTAASTNSKRNGGVLHRSAIAAADKLAAPAALTSLSAVAGGSLTAATYYLAVVAGNVLGVTTISNNGSAQSQVTSGGNLTAQFTLAQVANATYYDLFCSTDAAAPKWVARITETQRANANGTVVTAVGTVANGSALGAGVIQIQVPGTGIQTTNAIFATNTAYTPASVSFINCAGYSRAHVKGQVSLTGFGAAPALTLVPFYGNQVAGSTYHAGQSQPVPLVTGPGQALSFELVVELDGEPAFAVLIDTLTGTGVSVSLWVELA